MATADFDQTAVPPEKTLAKTAQKKHWRRSGDSTYYNWLLFGGNRPTPITCLADSTRPEVGYQCAFPRLFRFGEQLSWSMEIGESLFAEKDAGESQELSLFGHILDDALENQFEPVMCFPNSDHVQRLSQSFSMIHFLDLWKMTLVLQPHRLLPANVPKFFATGGFSPLLLSRHLSRSMMRRLDSADIRILRPGTFGTWADELWRQTRLRKEAGVVKDFDYLRWRYDEHPDTYRIYQAMQGNKTAGLLVTKIRAKSEDDIYGMIVDLMLPSHNRLVLHKLLLEAEMDFISEKCIAIDTWLAPHAFFIPALFSFGFIPTTRQPLLLQASQLSNIKKKRWGNPRHWFLTMGDTQLA